MQRIWATLALAVAAAVAGCSGSQDGGRLKWKKEPEKALEFAQFTGKPMLLYFTSHG